jgi:hypothetical protein
VTALFVVCSFSQCHRRTQDPAALGEAIVVAIAQNDNHATVETDLVHVLHMMIVVEEEMRSGYLMRTSLNSKC